MQFLFVHTNFPAQFVHWAAALAAQGHTVHAIGSATAGVPANVKVARYGVSRGSTPGIFNPATRYEADCIRGAAAANVALAMAKQGFKPDLIIGHLGWGETLFLRDVWPDAKIAIYAEFHTRAHGLDVDFDPEFERLDFDRIIRVRAKSGSVLMALIDADYAIAPTQFQADTFPKDLRSKITVAHDGVDTGDARPRSDARLVLPNGAIVRPGDKVITYINRNLEPLRGLHIFLRALPDVLAAHPDAHVVVVGSANPSPYGLAPPKGQSWRDIFMREVGTKLDTDRVHFLGRVTRAHYLDVLAVSAAHVYLTYPFVLSWSLLEAMSAECLVIGSDTAPVREVIQDGHNGLCVDFFDVAGLSARLIDALSKPRGYDDLRKQARADIIARYDLNTVCLPRLLALTNQWIGMPS